MKTKRTRKPVSLDTKIKRVIKQYAEIDKEIKALEGKRNALKVKIIDISEETELNSFSSDHGSIIVVRAKPRETIDKKKVQSLLSIEQFKECIKVGSEPKPSVRFKSE